ncbi:MAG: LysR family transcriptional regulator [Gammaproteobacteria bacterium]|nr:LysR family transcriptional regulator [Gammaproteobacteria bacterium]
MDRLRNLDLNLLVTLDALLRSCNVTRAAGELGTTQSAASHALARLRQLFDDPLLVKTSAGMTPTPRALELAAPVRQILELARGTLLPATAFEPRTVQRTITLCLGDIGEIAVLPPLMSRLQELAPRCTLLTLPFEPGGFEAVLERGLVDLAFASGLDPVGDVLQQRLYSHDFVAIVSEDCAVRDTLTAQVCGELEHLMLAPPQRGRSWIEQALQRAGVRPRVRLTTPHYLVMPLLVERDAGLIAVVPRLLAETFARMARIRILKPGFDLPRIEVCQYWHRRVDADPFHRWLRGCVREALYRNPTVHVA